MELDQKLEYEILKAMAEDGVTNTRAVIDLMVSRGWPQQTVRDHLVEMYARGLFDLKPDPRTLLN